MLCIPLYVLYASLKIQSFYYLLLGAFLNTETFGVGGKETEKDNVKMAD